MPANILQHNTVYKKTPLALCITAALCCTPYAYAATTYYTDATVSNNLTLGSSDSVYFSGTTAQTMSGTIDGSTISNGYVYVLNSEGVTFSEAIGAINSIDELYIGDSSGTSSTAVFLNEVVIYDYLSIQAYGNTISTTNISAVFNDAVTISNNDLAIKSRDNNMASSVSVAFADTVDVGDELYIYSRDNSADSSVDVTFSDVVNVDDFINIYNWDNSADSSVSVIFSDTLDVSGSLYIKNYDNDATGMTSTVDVTFNGVVIADELQIISHSNTSDASISMDFNSANNSITSFDLSAVDEADDGTVSISLGSGIDAGDTVFTGTTSVIIGDVSDSPSIELNVSGIGLEDGESITLFDSVAATSYSSDANSAIFSYGSFELYDTEFYDYSFDASAVGSTVVTASANSTTDIAASLDTSEEVAETLLVASNAVYSTGDSDLIEYFDTMINASGASATTAAEQLNVQSDMLTSTSSIVSTNSTVFDVTSIRLASVRSGEQYSGVATGDMAVNKGAWVRTFGSWSEKDTVGASYGYSASSYGIAMGIDVESSTNVRVGLAFAMAKTNVEGDGSGNYENEIDTYQISVYTDYTTDEYYVEGMFGLAHNTNDSSYEVLSTESTANYNSHNVILRVAGGMPFEVADATYLTPNSSFTYTYLYTDAYTEDGELAKYVAVDDVISAVGVLDAKIHHVFELDSGSMSPAFHMGVSYEFGDTNVSSTANFVGQTTNFTTTSEETLALSGVYGASLEYQTDEWTLSAAYDGEANEESISHTVSLQARYEF